MKREIQRKRNKRGFVLPFAGTMVVLLSITGLGLLRVGLSARVQAAKTTAEIAARAAADAGFTKALYEMNKTAEVGDSANSWSTQTLFDSLSANSDLAITWGNTRVISSESVALPVASANYNYQIQEVVKNSLYKITSTGQSGWAQKTVLMTVRRQGIFDYGIYSCGYAFPKHQKHDKWPGRRKPPKKGGHLKIKGYDLDTYSSNPGISPSGNLVLRTNSKHKGAVKLEKGSIIDGDIVVGPGGKPDKIIQKKDGSDVTGNTYTGAEMPEFPAVIVPEKLTKDKGKTFKITGNGNNTPKLSGYVTYKEFKLDGDQVVEVQSNCTMYVEGDMKLEDGAQLVITKNSSLTLYIGGKLEIKSKDAPGLVNETQDPTKFIVYGTDTCSKVKLEKVGDFYGAVYAPFAKVEIKKNEDVYGALVGWEVKLEKDKKDDNHDFYFDEALGSGDGTARYVKAVWSEQ